MVLGDGNDMNEKLLFVWLLVVVAISLVFHHFWASAVYALGKTVALNLVSLPGLVSFAVGFFGVNFLP